MNEANTAAHVFAAIAAFIMQPKTLASIQSVAHLQCIGKTTRSVVNKSKESK